MMKVLNGSANLTIGAVTPSTIRAQNFSWSMPFFYGYMLFAIPPGKSYTALEKLFFPFHNRVWICSCVIIVVAIAIMIILKLTPRPYRDFVIGKSNDMPFFNMLNACLGGTISTSNSPSRNFARFVLLIWLLSTLVLRNAYQGKLFHNLRSKQHKSPYFRLDELYESDMKLYLPDAYYQIVADIVPKYKHR